MPRQQRPQGGLKHIGIERSLQTNRELHRVDVRSPRIIKRMEQQTFLQRRQRQDVVKPRIVFL